MKITVINTSGRKFPFRIMEMGGKPEPDDDRKADLHHNGFVEWTTKRKNVRVEAVKGELQIYLE